MVYSSDDEEVGVANEVKSPKNQPQFSQTTMGQYWLGIAQTSFQINLKCFQKVATELKKD